MLGSTYEDDYWASTVGGTVDDLAVVDGGSWTRVATFGHDDWKVSSPVNCYPFEGGFAPLDVVHAGGELRPYRYYRLRTNSGATNGVLLVMNWGLWGYKVAEGVGDFASQCDSTVRSDLTSPVQLITKTAPFTYSAGGDYTVSGNVANVANQVRGSGHYTTTGVQLSIRPVGNHFLDVSLNVDMLVPHTVLAAAVCGYVSTHHRPQGQWALDGSQDGSFWANVHTFEFNDWTTKSCYPFNVVTNIAKGPAYRHFRVRSLSPAMNGNILIMNLGLWGCKGTACGGTFHTASTMLDGITVKSRAAEPSSDDIIAGLAKQVEQLQQLLAEQSQYGLL